MIHKIYASDKRFKAVEFQSGLNIILADKKEESHKKDSRNGLGKTTLINIIQFLLGAQFDESLFPVDETKSWVFYLEITLKNHKFLVARSISDPGVIDIQGNVDVLPVTPDKDVHSKANLFKLDEWKKVLGICLFGLSYEEDKGRHDPSFRNLISYFARNKRESYIDPFSYFKSQPAWSVQVHNAFLLQLCWQHAITAQEIADKLKAIKSLKDALKTGVTLSLGELEAERVRIREELDKKQQAVQSFNVHPEYQKIQEEADQLTKSVHRLSNKNLVLRRKLENYKQSIESEKVSTDTGTIEKLYEEAGVHFQGSVTKTLDEVKQFHSTVIKNRKQFLQVEIEEIKNKIAANDRSIEQQNQKRSDLMGILQTHGALDEFNRLQEQFIESKTHLSTIEEKIANIKEMSVKTKEIKASKIELETKLQRDYEESRPSWEKAIAVFNENTQALYNKSGSLIINVSDKGYSFKVEIPRSGSEGVSKMKIFCYDLMLVDLFSQNQMVDFLIHDSTIFDGVDSRQIALALEHAHKKSDGQFQYICAFNSDMLTQLDFTEGFNVDAFVRLTLNDRHPEDRLMGFAYE